MIRVIQKKSNSDKFKGFVWSPEFGATIISVLLLLAIPVTILLTSKQQDIRQQASTVNKTATISVVPISGTYKLGKEFGIQVIIDGGSQNIDSVSARVETSSNLIVTSLTLTPRESGGCELSYPNNSDIPSAMNLSFLGILPTSPTSHCTLYSITVKPVSSGNATVTISNAQATTPQGNGNIIQNVTGGTFSITP